MPPAHKQFNPWHVKHLLLLLESWVLVSFLNNFKLAWKTATFLALFKTKHCSDLTLLCIGSQHFFLQHHAAIFILASGGKTDGSGHLQPQIHIESHSNVNLCSVFYLEAYLCHTSPQGAVASAAFAAGISLVSILQAGHGPEFLAQPDCSTYITTTNWHQDSI